MIVAPNRGAGGPHPPVPVRIYVLCNTRGFSIAQLKV